MGGYKDAKFDAFYKKQYAQLLFRAYYVTDNYHDAEELVDEAFMVYRQKATAEKIDAPSKYILMILGNLIGNYLKSQRVEQSIFLPLEALKEPTGEADGLQRPLTDVLPKELASWEAEILTLRYEKNYSFEQISSILHLEPVSCRSRLFRAKLHCRNLMNQKNFS